MENKSKDTKFDELANKGCEVVKSMFQAKKEISKLTKEVEGYLNEITEINRQLNDLTLKIDNGED